VEELLGTTLCCMNKNAYCRYFSIDGNFLVTLGPVFKIVSWSYLSDMLIRGPEYFYGAVFKTFRRLGQCEPTIRL
jgi:hypothetical protein